MEIRRRIDATLALQSEQRYLRIPFELPPGTNSFEITLGVPEVDGAVIDLGCEGPDDWRGWSGGARRSFVIEEDDATPGYLPGLRPGLWHVILGLHALPMHGVELSITVSVPATHRPDHGPHEDPCARHARGSERDLPAPPGMRWYAGDTHAHSLHSDGALSLWELANEGVRSGLDFLCVTDHNTTSHHAHLAGVGDRHGITLVPGQEVTTHLGHANAYGDIGFVDFRTPGQGWVETVTERGGFLSVNHPVSEDCSWLHELDHEPEGVELYHGSWYQQPMSTSALAWFQRWRRDVVLVGGGDFHHRETPLRPGMPTTWVAAEVGTADAILEGLRAGRTTITGSVRLDDGVGRPVLDECPILIREVGRLRVIRGAGLVLVSGTGRRLFIAEQDMVVEAPLSEGPHRLEDTHRMTLALCR